MWEESDRVVSQAAFETEIAEPDKEGGALRYRGVDIKELAGHVTFGNAWGLLVDDAFEPGLPLPSRTRSRSIPATSGWTFRARWRCSRRPGACQRQVDQAKTITERFMIRWRGEPDPRHVKAVDAYWTSAAEHGMNASTFTARVIASTGADVAAALSGAVGAMSGPLHGGAPARVLATNVEFWAIVLDFAQVPPHMFTSMFTCARTAGWAAHILEQKRTGRLVRPTARYVGPRPGLSVTFRAPPA